MAQPTNKREYRLSDGNLVLTGTRIVQAARRDDTEILAYGIAAGAIDDLETEVLKLLEIPTDEELAGMMKEATTAKRNKRAEITTYISKEIMSRVNIVYADTSGTYERFGVKDIHAKTDGDFLITMHRVVRQATALLTPLAGTGLTAPIIAGLNTKADEFLELWKDQTAAIDDRDNAVETRITAGNAVYATLSKIAELGKTIWQGVSDAKHNDYVLYPGGEPAHEQELEGTVAANLVVNLSATGLTGSSVITVTAVEGSFNIGFAENPIDEPATNEQTIAEGTTAEFTASDIGFLTGVRERLNIFNPSATVAARYLVLIV